MVSRDEPSSPASPFQSARLSLLREQKRVAEEATVLDMLVGELSASSEIEQMANFLLTFEGAAATVLLLNLSEFTKFFGGQAIAIALMLLGVAGTAGLVIRWIGLRIQAFLRISAEARKAPVREIASQIFDAIEPGLPDDEVEAVAFVQEHFNSLMIDYQAVHERFRAAHLTTLNSLGRFLEKRKRTAAVPFGYVLSLLRLQRWQERLLLVQTAITLGLLIAAAFVLSVTSL